MRHIFAAFLTAVIFSCTPVPSESGPYPVVLFCPEDACVARMAELVRSSSHSDCALYDLGSAALIAALNETGARVVLDRDAYDKNRAARTMPGLRPTSGSNAMHNKFCIINSSMVITGSVNPTLRGEQVNNNNLVIVESATLSANYMAEFQELWRGVYGRGAGVPDRRLYLNGMLVENYFCPEDCSPAIFTDRIAEARQSVRFMAFSFTHRDIAEALIQAHRRGVLVEGIMEKTQNSRWSVYPMLLEGGIDVRLDSNPANMHHKVFVVDGTVVITGSANPTRNGLERNDENILVFHSREIAGQYELEFSRLWP